MMNRQFWSAPNLKFSARIYHHLLLLLIYALLAIALTWPTITHLSTYLPGDGGDDPAIAWNLWWVKYALLNAGQNPFHSDFMFYPIGINLAFYTLTVLNAVTALPFTLNLGVATASNLHMFFTFIIGGYGAFLLTRYILATTDDRRLTAQYPFNDQLSSVNRLAWACAAVAGIFYAFASNKLFYVALGQFNIASSHWVPFVVLYIIRTRHNPHLKNALMAGLFLTLQTWAEMTYTSFILVFLGLYWLYEGTLYFITSLPFRQSLSHHSFLPHLRATVMLIVVFLIGLSPILGQMLPDMQAEGDFFVEGNGFADTFSADVLGFIIPTMHHPWLGGLVTQTGIKNYTVGQHIYLGATLLGLALVSLAAGYRRPQIRFWLLAALVFALLCLGPNITVNGHATGLPGPFVILQNLPFFKGNRYPSRYSVMLLLSLSVLAGWAMAQIVRSKAASSRVAGNKSRFTFYGLRFALFALLPLLFIFEHLSIPLPQSDMRVPPAYQLIAADPGDFTVLDIPFAWRNGFRITGALTTQFMFGQFYQTAHQKHLLQGNTSRNPEFKFQYFTNAPIIKSLLALETGKTLPPEQRAADQTIAADALRFFNIKYIVVRPYNYSWFDGTKNITTTGQAVLPYIETVLPVDLIRAEPTISIYQVKDTSLLPPPSSFLLHPSPLSSLYFGEGWGLVTPGRSITALRREVRLLLPLTAGLQRVSLRLRQPDGLQTSPQSVSLALNGWESPPQAVGTDWQEVSFDLPDSVTWPGLHNAYLHFNKTSILTSALSPLDVTVLSAGDEVGDFGHIYVNGYEVSPNQRGYNVAIIKTDGSIEAANFDTHLDAAASTALADFINTTPADALVAVAAADEASANLGEAAVLALRGLGATADLRGCFRCSHAFIRQPDGQINEAFDRLYPVGVTTSLGLTEPAVAAEVDWVRVEPIHPNPTK